MWRSNQMLSLSSRSWNLFFLTTAKKKKYIYLQCWTFFRRKRRLFKNSALKFAQFSWQSPSWLPYWKIKTSRLQRAVSVLAATPTGGHIYAKLLFLWKFGGTRWEDVSIGVLFKRIHFTQTSLGVTLALQIRDGLRECASLLDLNDSIAKVLRRRWEKDACCRSSFVVGEKKLHGLWLIFHRYTYIRYFRNNKCVS